MLLAEGEQVKKYQVPVSFSDERGEITDLIENETINAVTIVTLKKGAVRGNHYHKETYQWNYLTRGEVEYLFRKGDGKKIKKTIMSKGDLILTPPGEHHTLVGLADSELLVLTRGPRGGQEYESDTYRLETSMSEQKN